MSHAAILNMLGLRTIHGKEYMDTSLLIKKAIDLYAEIDEPTAENIVAIYKKIIAPVTNEEIED